MDILNVKGQDEHDICKDHSARTQKDQYRVYPSKLSRKELESVYFSLIDNNLELKKTINTQQEQIKLLSTKINRITTQRNLYGPQKGCCKVLLNEHRDVVLDLKQVNEKLRERVRQLNMQLCSAKQFLKKTPFQASRCQNCMNFRNSTSTLYAKRSQTALRLKSTSSQYLLQDVTPLALEYTIENSVPESVKCTQNICKTTIEELQKDLDTLQKELAMSREQCQKLTDVSGEVCGLRDELQRARTRTRVAEDELVGQKSRRQELVRSLRSVEAQNESISLELTLERQQVRQLQAELRAEAVSRAALALSHATRAYDEPVRLGETSEAHEPVRLGETSEAHEPVRLGETSEAHASLEPSHSPTSENEPSHKSHMPARLVETSEAHTSHEPARAPSYEPSHMSHEPVRPAETTERSHETHGLSYEPSHDPVGPAGDSAESHRPRFDVPYQIEYGGGDARVSETDTIVPHSKEASVKRDQRPKKRREKNRRGKRNSSAERQEIREERRSTGSVSPVPSSTGTNKQGRTEDVREHSGAGAEVERRKIYRDIGVQSETQVFSRGVGEGTRAKDEGVQIGDSLHGRIEVDTRTYSRKSKSRTYSVERHRAGDTEREMSSLSDLPSERNSPPSDYISPGEQLPSSPSVETSSADLSEGELPPLGGQLSYGEVDVRSVGEEKGPLSPSVRAQQAIRDVKRELSRCSQLLGAPGVSRYRVHSRDGS